MTLQVQVKTRTRCGSYDTFERRYGPTNPPSGESMWGWDEIPTGTDQRLIWTILDCDGVLIVSPGEHFVNRFAFMICERPWSDVELMNPGYRW